MTDTLDRVRTILVSTLELSQGPTDLQPDTALFGAMPELDSFGVLQLVAAIEEGFGITIHDDEFGAELFDTVGTLTSFVDEKLASA
jgi:acyl carrier protein